MALLDRIRSALGWPSPQLIRAASDYAANVIPPLEPQRWVNVSDAITLPAVFRALQVITTSAAQLPLDVEKRGQIIDPPSLVRRPCLELTRSEWVEAVVMSLATAGNAFLKVERAAGAINELIPLDPNTVTVYRDPKTGAKRFGHNGREYDATSILHIPFMSLPGRLRAIGPIQAAQSTMRTQTDIRDYAAGWFDNSGQPAGILSSDQPLTAADAKTYRDTWNNVDANGKPLPAVENPSRIKVLGKGLTYEPVMLTPSDALWLEAQSFSTLEIARLFGIPAALLLTNPEGSSMTYTNIEAAWLEFVRFTLVKYLRAIEDALTTVTPNGQTVRFRIDALLRADTKTRYEAHEIALRAGFLTIDEVRAIENRAPLTTAAQPQEAAP